MAIQDKARRVTLYMGESDHQRGKALYMAVLELLKNEGAAGATVLRGLAGFGAGGRLHTAGIVDLAHDLPLRLEWVDTPEAVERLLPRIRRLADEALITVEEVEIVQHPPAGRADPLEQPTAAVMKRDPVAIRPDTPLAEIIRLLLEKESRSLPVVDDVGRAAGIITDGDLLRRVGLSARLDDPDALLARLAELRRRPETAAELMTRPVIAVGAGEPLRRAASLMVEKDLKRLPVIGEDGRLAGWVSRVDILRALARHRPAGDGEEEEEAVPTGTALTELMYRDVPTVPVDTPLEEILAAIERTRRRRVVVVNDRQQVVGLITDGDLLRRSRPGAQPGVLARLREILTGQPPSVRLPEAGQTAAELMTAPALTVRPETPLADALQLMLAHQIKRLPVVDAEGRLLGLLGRASLLRGLLQAGG